MSDSSPLPVPRRSHAPFFVLVTAFLVTACGEGAEHGSSVEESPDLAVEENDEKPAKAPPPVESDAPLVDAGAEQGTSEPSTDDRARKAEALRTALAAPGFIARALTADEIEVAADALGGELLVAVNAARALTLTGAPAVPALARRLASGKESNYGFIRRALRDMPAQATDALVTLLQSQKTPVVLGALWALRNRSHPFPRDALVPLVVSDDYHVRKEATELLAANPDDSLVPALVAAFARSPGKYSDLVVPYGPKAFPAVVELLKKKGNEHPVIPLLGKLGDARAVEPLIAMLRGDDKMLAPAAAYALADIGGASAVDALIAALDDPSLLGVAARALGEAGDGRAEGPLLAKLANATRETRRDVIPALGKVGGDRAARELIRSFPKSGYKDVSLETAALAEMGAAAMGPLQEALRNPDEQYRVYATRALGKSKRAEALQLLVRLASKKETAFSGREGLVAAGDAAVAPLKAAIEAEKLAEARARLVSALGHLGVPAVSSLVAMLSNSDLRLDALAALSRTPKDKRVRAEMQKLLDAKDLKAITRTYYGYIRVGWHEAVPLLIETLEKLGTKNMATTFLNTGNARLEKAAERWARRNGYLKFPARGGAAGTWGSGR